MIDSEKLVNQTSAFIEKNLAGGTPFQSTSGFISYIGYKEFREKSDSVSKPLK
jgi:hypothetical protein